MKYEEARASIKTGDVLAWTHKSWRSWYDIQIQIVRFFTQSEYSHVGIAWCIAGRVFILESVGAGIRIFPLSLELPFFHLATGKSLTRDQLEFALSKMGQRYSKVEGVLAMFGLNNRKDDAWQCAEYVCTVLGLPCKATPSAVVAHLLESGATLKEVQS